MSRDALVYEPLPRDVPGFSEALRAGQLPQIPPTPPALLPGRTANRCFLRHFAIVIAAAAGLAVVMSVADRQTFPSPWAEFLVVGLGFVWFWYAFLRVPNAFGNRVLEEIEQGYTTLTWTYGMVTSRVRRRCARTQFRVPWRYDGIWVLADDGRVLSPPRRDVEPPGFFPSPNRRGCFELWTGAAWSGLYRGAPRRTGSGGGAGRVSA